MLIGELAAKSRLSAQDDPVLRAGRAHARPPRTPAGYRNYPPAALDRLAFIANAQVAGFTLAEIRSVLAIRDSGDPPCRHVATLIGQHLAQVERRIAELTRTHHLLIDLQRRAAALNPADCAESQICSILTAPDQRPPARHCQLHWRNSGPGPTLRCRVVRVGLTMSDDAGDEDELLA